MVSIDITLGIRWNDINVCICFVVWLMDCTITSLFNGDVIEDGWFYIGWHSLDWFDSLFTFNLNGGIVDGIIVDIMEIIIAITILIIDRITITIDDDDIVICWWWWWSIWLI